MIIFEHFGVKDIIDILLVALLMQQTYRIMKSSGATTVFQGIMTFILLWVVISQLLNMRLLGAILDKFISFGFIVLIIIFQDEIRRFLSEVGSRGRIQYLSSLFLRKKTKVASSSHAMPIVMACLNMAKQKTGALIVMRGRAPLTPYENTGVHINADVSTQLIECIFYKNNELHDGAIIIDEGKIISAACVLPVIQSHSIPSGLGLRHRSALATSMECDAKVIIVSEQRGQISLAYRGKFHLNISGEELQRALTSVD